jgi:hypothetical protein
MDQQDVGRLPLTKGKLTCKRVGARVSLPDVSERRRRRLWLKVRTTASLFARAALIAKKTQHTSVNAMGPQIRPSLSEARSRRRIADSPAVILPSGNPETEDSPSLGQLAGRSAVAIQHSKIVYLVSSRRVARSVHPHGRAEQPVERLCAGILEHQHGPTGVAHEFWRLHRPRPTQFNLQSVFVG